MSCEGRGFTRKGFQRPSWSWGTTQSGVKTRLRAFDLQLLATIRWDLIYSAELVRGAKSFRESVNKAHFKTKYAHLSVSV